MLYVTGTTTHLATRVEELKSLPKNGQFNSFRFKSTSPRVPPTTWRPGKQIPSQDTTGEGAKPFSVVNVPRLVPLPLMETLQKKSQRHDHKGAIELVDEPTEWCAPDGTCWEDCWGYQNRVLPDWNWNVERESSHASCGAYTVNLRS
jgi:hypothetical protein